MNLIWPPLSNSVKPAPSGSPRLPRNAGQVVIEYVLLLVVIASLGAYLVKELVSRGDEPGLFVDKWDKIIKVIAEDNPEE